MTKKSKAEQVEEKVQDAAPAAEQAEQMEGADAARQPSEEELKAMLRGENRQHDEALAMPGPCCWARTPWPSCRRWWARCCTMAAPAPPGSGSAAARITCSWPGPRTSRRVLPCSCRLTKGKSSSPCPPCLSWKALPNDLTVEDIHPWSQGGGANVAVSMIEGKNPMWFYDPLYLRDKDDLTPGVTQTFLLSGLAIALRKALLDDVNITQGPQYEAWAAQWLAENPGKTRLDVPPLKISMTGRQLIMPGRRFAEYQVRTKVERVDDVKLEKMDIKVLYVRFPFDQRPDMVLPIYASKMVLRDYDPQEGDEVDAYVWLQGRVIDMDESPAQ